MAEPRAAADAAVAPPRRGGVATGFRTVAIGATWFWLLLFALAPNLLVLAVSFLQRGEDEFVRLAFSLDSYVRLFDPLYAGVLWSSFRLAAAATLICLLIAFPFALLVARSQARWRPWLLALVVIPFWTSSLVRTYALVVIIKTQGLLNEALLALGLISEPLEILYTGTAVLIGFVYTELPFMVLPLYAAMEKLDWRLVEAARDLGANAWAVLWRILVPLTLSGIVAGCMLVFLPALGMFYVADVLGGAKELLIGNLIRDQFLSARDWPFGAAASVVVTLLMAALIGVYALSRRQAGTGRAA
jgi:spermidine/putrescine transport system permease protein